MTQTPSTRRRFLGLFSKGSSVVEPPAAESKAEQRSREKAFLKKKALFNSLVASGTGAVQAQQAPVDEEAAARGCSQILPGLFLSGKEVEASAQVLKANKITHVLQIGIELTPSHLGQFTYMNVPIFDVEDQDIVCLVPACLKFIKDGLRSGRVLVHCAYGISRSASIVIAHVMKTKGMGYQQALQFVRAKRSIVCPNLGFAMQLQHFEASGCTVPANWETWSLQRFLDSNDSSTSGSSPGSSYHSTPRTSYGGAPDPLVDMPALLPPQFR